MARNAEGLNERITEIAALREEFYKIRVPGTDKGSIKN
jgi:succinate dehydrogenase / fumarate reductase flavoprotein subunit